jgi:cyclohexadienyl dehydratase
MVRLGRGRRTTPLLALVLAGCAARVAPPLRVGTSGDYPPFSVAEGGTMTGLDVEVARRFASHLGRPLELVRLRWPDLETDLAAGRFDLAMGGVTVRPERALGAVFTRPVLATGVMVLARGAREIAAIDRPSTRLAVNAGGHLEREARRLFPRATIVPAADNRGLPGLLVAGLADAVLTDDVEADVFQAEVPTATRLGPLTRDRKAYLGRDLELVNRLDAWLRAREDDGTLADLRARWLGEGRARPISAFASDVEALLALVDLRLALMPAVARAKAARGLPIADPEQEARVLARVRVEAPQHRLDAEAAVGLFQTLLAAARALQAEVLAAPALAAAEKAADLDGELRPALRVISRLILARAGAVAPGAAGLDLEQLAAGLDARLASHAARLAVARAVVALARAPRAGYPARSKVISRTSLATRSGAAVAARTSSAVSPGASSRSTKPSGVTSIHARSVTTERTQPSAVGGYERRSTSFERPPRSSW